MTNLKIVITGFSSSSMLDFIADRLGEWLPADLDVATVAEEAVTATVIPPGPAVLRDAGAAGRTVVLDLNGCTASSETLGECILYDRHDGPHDWRGSYRGRQLAE